MTEWSARCYCDSAYRAERAISDAVARMLLGEVMVLGGLPLSSKGILPVKWHPVRSCGHDQISNDH